jgi:hypothetical protein
MYTLRLGLSVGWREAMFGARSRCRAVRRISQSNGVLPDPAAISPIRH